MSQCKVNLQSTISCAEKRYIFCLLITLLFACAGDRPDNLGVVLGKLTPCPTTPNCVSSDSSNEQHAIAPLQGSISAIKLILLNMDNAKIIVDKADYLYVEFTSKLGFVDDVEFYAPQQGQQIQVRSASRLGRSDMGVNRERIEHIRLALNQ